MEGRSSREEFLRAAPRAFHDWIRQFPFAPFATHRLIRDVAYREHRFARLTTEYEARRIVHCSGRCSGRYASGSAWDRRHEFDAWSVSDDELRGRTIRAEACGECSGSGAIACGACGGDGRATCGGCHGSGKAYGYAKDHSYRRMNCKACRGQGTLDCSCVAGRVSCPGCEGSGRVDGWLAVERSTRVDVRCHPTTIDADAVLVTTLTFPTALTATDMSRLAAEHQLDPASVVVVPPPPPNSAERVRGQKLELIALPEVAVTYAMNGRTETVTFVGRRMLAPSCLHSFDRLVETRSRFLRHLRNGALALLAIAGLVYAARGPYFWTADTALLLLALALGAGAAFAAAWLGTLGRPAARVWAVLALAAFFASGALAVIAEPQLRDARAFLSRGDLDAARTELRALGIDKPAEHEAWADLTLAVTLSRSSPAEAARAAAEVPDGSPQRQSANRHVAALYQQLSDDCVAREDWPCAIAEARQAETFGRAGSLAKVATPLSVRAIDITRRGLRARTRAARAEHADAAERLWGYWRMASGTDPPPSFRQLQAARLRDVEREQAQSAAQERTAKARTRARPEPPREEARPREDAAVETVYITRTGSKYHRGGCRYLRSSAIPISRAEARHNYSPCSVCF